MKKKGSYIRIMEGGVSAFVVLQPATTGRLRWFGFCLWEPSRSSHRRGKMRWANFRSAIKIPRFFFSFRFPVILSIENHCSIQQQKKIAQYLREIFGDKLDVGDILSRDFTTLPSPQSLKGKILIKVRTNK